MEKGFPNTLLSAKIQQGWEGSQGYVDAMIMEGPQDV